MLKLLAVLLSLVFVMLFSSCSIILAMDNNDFLPDISGNISNDYQGDEQKLMFEDTIKEAAVLNQNSWLGGMDFLQIIDENNVKEEWFVEMPQGLDGRGFKYPHYGETRLTEITIMYEKDDDNNSYSIYGIKLGDSYSDAKDTLLLAGYEPLDKPYPANQNPQTLEKQRRFFKYNIWITLQLNSRNEDDANIERINCLASDPSSPDNDFVY